jgi:hypothetical protein
LSALCLALFVSVPTHRCCACSGWASWPTSRTLSTSLTSSSSVSHFRLRSSPFSSILAAFRALVRVSFVALILHACPLCSSLHPPVRCGWLRWCFAGASIVDEILSEGEGSIAAVQSLRLFRIFRSVVVPIGGVGCTSPCSHVYGVAGAARLAGACPPRSGSLTVLCILVPRCDSLCAASCRAGRRCASCC